jgi:hypothetical protein
MDTAWLIASSLSLAFAALVTTALVIVYSFNRFEKTQVGRQFMLTKLSLALILDYWATIVFFVRPPSGYVSTMPARTVICTIVGVLMARWLIILIKAQQTTRRSRRHPVWHAPDEPPSVRREQ